MTAWAHREASRDGMLVMVVLSRLQGVAGRHRAAHAVSSSVRGCSCGRRGRGSQVGVTNHVTKVTTTRASMRPAHFVNVYF